MNWIGFIFKNIKRILFVIAALSAVVYFVSCTPQNRLNRLVKNNPELAKTDTVYVEKAINIPAVNLDTAVAVNTNVNEVSQILEHYKNVIDSLTRVKLGAEIKNYIIQRPCLQKPLTFNLKDGAFCTIQQANGVFSVVYKSPAKKYQVKVPVVVMKVEPIIKYNWQMFAGGFFFSVLLIVCLLIFFKPKI